MCPLVILFSYSIIVWSMIPILIVTILQCYRATGTDGNDKLLKIVPDWTEEAANDDHLWSVTSHNVDFCYIGESECSVSCNVNIFVIWF